ncbi:MAG TPA: response regulator transcription factor [Opitutaceae bacterium]|nr:response regulator transcription factor [Opitutaceae bacterium]
MSAERTAIFVVDDHPMVRELLTDYLKTQPDFDVLGTAEAPGQALAAMEAAPPDVAIVDLTLKRGSGLDLIKDLQRRLPDVLVIVLSMHEELTDMERAFRAGAVGYVMKRESTSQIVDAIRQVRAGRIYANPDALVQLTTRYLGRPADAAAGPSELLSDREMEVFRLLGAGRSTKDISASLGVGLKTVQTYCGRIKLKLGFKDGAELSRAAYRWQEHRY